MIQVHHHAGSMPVLVFLTVDEGWADFIVPFSILRHFQCSSRSSTNVFRICLLEVLGSIQNLYLPVR